MRRLGGALVVAAALGALPTRAQAEESDHQRAINLFNDARRDITNGDCAAAKPKLLQSINLEPSIGAHISMADCVQQDDPYDAFWHLRDAALLAFLRHDDRLATTEERATALGKTLGGMKFDIDPVDLHAPAFDLRVDGRPVDRFHIAGTMAFPPGDHTVTITVADGRRFERSVHIDAGAPSLVRVVLLKTDKSELASTTSTSDHCPERPPQVAPSKMSGQEWLALGLAGVGVASLAVGTAYGIVAIEKRSELDRACNGDADACTGPPSRVDPVLDSAETNATVSTILLSAGAAFVIGAAVVWFTAPKDRTAARAPRAVITW